MELMFLVAVELTEHTAFFVKKRIVDLTFFLGDSSTFLYSWYSIISTHGPACQQCK